MSPKEFLKQAAEGCDPTMPRQPKSVPTADAKSEFDRGAAIARIEISPIHRHALPAFAFAHGTPSGDDPSRHLKAFAGQVETLIDKDARGIDVMLASQAIHLDAMFTDFAFRAYKQNAAGNLQAAEVSMRLALKAQANSRATLEALGKQKRGGEQVVKHIHVDNRGGQAVIADSVQTGGQKREVDDQSHEPGVEATNGATMLSHDPLGHGVPMPSFERKEALPTTRRTGRRTDR